MPTLELLHRREGTRLLLSSPEVGWFTGALPAGALLAPGATAGTLHSLGRPFRLLVPRGVAGRVACERPERVHEPVGYGTTLYELAPLGSEEAVPEAGGPRAADDAKGLLFSAPYSGRFWQRPAPKDPAFVREGDVLEVGQTLGLIEVMKTFTHLVYAAQGDLPERARLVRFLVEDGGEVKGGGALLELEPD